ncbi:MAG: DNA polymerase III subunit delta [Prevotellaceae bacterium]|jgi:DNA polymerase-3 subunit delta|nr:DNA polymerase III subunit delta [Prevotellaceae bacterium]
MAKAENKKSFEQILKDLKAKQYAPVYFLMGEEAYYIDKIADFIEKNVLSDEEKDMNLSIFHGKDSKIEDVLMAAKQLPMMADYQVVIAKEAQHYEKTIDKIEFYVKNPAPSTILVFCYKYKKLDARKKYVKEIDNQGVLFETGVIYDNQLPKFIKDYCAEINVKIEEKAVGMLVEYIGVDLARMTGEIDKLLIIKPEGANTITSDLVYKNIGISKDYNAFELARALGVKDVLLANRIVDYFGKNPKEFAMPPTLTTLFNYFEKILLYNSLENKSDIEIQSVIGVHPFVFRKDYLAAVRNYSTGKICNIIGFIRTADVRSKGFGFASADSAEEKNYQILKELVFRILH